MKTKWAAISVIIFISLLLLVSFFKHPANRFRLNRLQSKLEGSMITNQAAGSAHTVPDIEIQSTSGQFLKLSDFRGKIVFLNFWATWCPPCLAELPSINSLKKKLADRQDVDFIMLDVDGNLEKSAAFMQNKAYDLNVYAPASNIPSSLLGRGIPVTVIIGKNGDIIYRHEGTADYDTPAILELINALN
jgi:thiol-disulfide isomerase/thioredoxin